MYFIFADRSLLYIVYEKERLQGWYCAIAVPSGFTIFGQDAVYVEWQRHGSQ